MFVSRAPDSSIAEKVEEREGEKRCINNDGERHCISRGLVRVRDSYRQTMFYSPVAFSQRTGEYQDRPSPVNNQIRGVRKSLSCSRKRHRWRGTGPGDKVYRGTHRGRIPLPDPFANYRGSALLDSDVLRTGVRATCLRRYPTRTKEFMFKLRRVNPKRVGFTYASFSALQFFYKN